MLLLIFAHRHQIAVIDQNVGRHQNRIVEQPGRRRQSARDFVFIRMTAFEQRFGCDSRQDPGQLSDLRHVALPKKRAALDVETAREKIQRDPPAVGP